MNVKTNAAVVKIAKLTEGNISALEGWAEELKVDLGRTTATFEGTAKEAATRVRTVQEKIAAVQGRKSGAYTSLHAVARKLENGPFTEIPAPADETPVAPPEEPAVNEAEVESQLDQQERDKAAQGPKLELVVDSTDAATVDSVPGLAKALGKDKPNLTKMGKTLMTLIGKRELSFFDGGIVEGEGIWHNSLSGETAGAPGMPKNATGVANVVTKLVEDGYLTVAAPDENGDVWVSLTKLGAETAVQLAGPAEATPAPEVKDEQKPNSMGDIPTWGTAKTHGLKDGELFMYYGRSAKPKAEGTVRKYTVSGGTTSMGGAATRFWFARIVPITEQQANAAKAEKAAPADKKAPAKKSAGARTIPAVAAHKGRQEWIEANGGIDAYKKAYNTGWDNATYGTGEKRAASGEAPVAWMDGYTDRKANPGKEGIPAKWDALRSNKAPVKKV